MTPNVDRLVGTHKSAKEMRKLWQAKCDEELAKREEKGEEIGWDEVVEISIAAGLEVLGPKPRKAQHPWMTGREEEAKQLDMTVAEARRSYAAYKKQKKNALDKETKGY